MAQDGALVWGYNLDALCRYVGDEEVDLVYLGPRFNSNTDYDAWRAEGL